MKQLTLSLKEDIIQNSIKRSASRDLSKSKNESKKQTILAPDVILYMTKCISFKSVTYGKFWKREKIGNRIVIWPKSVINPTGISKEIINHFKDSLSQCDSDNIPEFYSIQGIIKSNWLLYHSILFEEKAEEDVIISHLMITNPYGDEDTGVTKPQFVKEWHSLLKSVSELHTFKNFVVDNFVENNSTISITRNPLPSDYLWIIPELRMESMNSPERDRDYFHAKINLHWIYPNWSFEIYPIKWFTLIDTPLSRVLTHKHNTNEFLNPQSGFLSLDRNGRIITFTIDDSNIMKYPLVGIWISGLVLSEEDYANSHLTKTEREDIKTSSLKHPLVWASWMRMLLCRNYWELRSSSKGKNTFLLLNFLKVGSSILPQLWEFKLCDAIEDSENNWVVSRFKNSSHSWLSSDKNLVFKFNSQEARLIDSFYSIWVSPTRQNIINKEQRKNSKRRTKSRNDYKEDNPDGTIKST